MRAIRLLRISCGMTAYEWEPPMTRFLPAIGRALMLATAILANASLANVLLNPGFETGDFNNWLLGGVHGPAGVGTDGQLISGTNPGFGDFFVNVHSGQFAAFAPIAALSGSGEQVTLTQVVSTAPNTTYLVGYFVGVGSAAQPGFGFESENTIVVNGTALQLTGLGQLGPGNGIGLTPSDMRHVYGLFTSGPGIVTATVTYTIAGSGTGRAGFSFDDFQFNVPEPAPLFLLVGGLLMMAALQHRRT